MKLKTILKQYGKQYLFWFCFFELFKTLFLLSNWKETAALSGTDIWGVYRHGLRMDISAAAYLTALPAFALVAYPWKQRLVDRLICWYSNVMIVLLTLLGLSDIGLYPEWQTRIGAQALSYLKTPQGVWQCLEWWQWLVALIIWVALCWGLIRLHSRLTRGTIENCGTNKVNIRNAAVQFLLSACLFLPIRGGVDTAPLNPSSVYFSEKLYANYAALNYFWKFVYSLTTMDKQKCPVDYMSEEEALHLLPDLKTESQESVPFHLKQLPKGQKPNVVFILLESYATRCMGCYGATEDLTPNLSRWSRTEGIQWNNFYATGNRSDRGFCALLAGYPALIQASAIMLFPEKMHDMELLPQVFEKQGYQRSFYYGGDIEFYNTKALLLRAGITDIIERSSFSAKDQMAQKWGVPDEVLWKRFGKDILQMKEPFFCGSYNISTHTPYDVPVAEKYVKGQDGNSQYKNSILYSDSCLNVLLTELKNSPLWDHTLVVITSDHTCPYPNPTPAQDAPENYHIPMIWLGGLVDHAEQVENICSQTDLQPTLTQQLGWEPTPTYFGKNMFGSHEYAFYYRDEYWGCITPETSFSINMDTQKMTCHKGVPSDSLLQQAKAWTQLLHLDFQKR